MALSTIVMRPFNLVSRSKLERAASPHTSDWGLIKLMKGPNTRIAAYDNALSRFHRSPELVLAVLTGNFDHQEKREAIVRMRAGMACPAALYEPSPNILPMVSLIGLPPFFRQLTAQPIEVVKEVHQLWSQDQSIGSGRGIDKSAPGPINFTGALERHFSLFSSGLSKTYEETVPVTPRAKQTIVGYTVKLADFSGKITAHYYYFASGCQVDGLAFEYQFRGAVRFR